MLITIVTLSLCSLTAARRHDYQASNQVPRKTAPRKPPSSYVLVGHDMDNSIDSRCTFYGDMSYQCETGDCDVKQDNQIRPSFQDSKNYCFWTPLKAVNCGPSRSTGGTWRHEDGVIRPWPRSVYVQPEDTIATCIFFKANWFECIGVADITGIQPWRGHFAGNSEEGYRGSVTNEARIHSGCPIQLRRRCANGAPPS